MQTRPDFKDKHAHKDAGMEFTIVIGCVPIALPTRPAGVVEVDWADVAHPPTTDDEPVAMLHVLRFDAESAGHVTPAEKAEFQLGWTKQLYGGGSRCRAPRRAYQR